ncbi:MAG: TIR domain-containing protein [Candidatus Lokiarchaeota archaeon]|nr:TIR domain-containing protein [Candidatus Lokiarchaeota archaeon]
MNKNEIFISHSSNDKDIADLIVDLLVTGTNVSNKVFFCSSLEGLGIPKGKNFIDYIKEQIQEPKLVIMILSPNYFESGFCMCELGASWILSHSIYPILVPPLLYSDVKDVLLGIQIAEINNKSDLDDLRDEIINIFNIKDSSTARWEIKRNQFLKKIKVVLKNIKHPGKVKYSEYKDIQNKYNQALEEYENSQNEIESLKNLIEELKKCKDSNEVNKIIISNLDDDEKFNCLVDNVKKEFRQVSVIVKRVLYYETSKKFFTPDPYDNGIWSDIEEEADRGFLCIDYDENIVSVNSDDLLIKKAIKAIKKLDKFLSEEVSSEFWELYEKENKHPPKLSNKRFWDYELMG